MSEKIVGSEAKRLELLAKLQKLDEEFERAMKARGFDPAQADNVPLTRELAQLQAERAELMQSIASTIDKEE